MVDEYTEFRTEVSKAMANEVIDVAIGELRDELDEILDKWVDNLLAQLSKKFADVGFEPNLAVKVTWDPDPPSVEIFGHHGKEGIEEGDDD